MRVYEYNDEKLKELVTKIQTDGYSVHYDQELTQEEMVEFFKTQKENKNDG